MQDEGSKTMKGKSRMGLGYVRVSVERKEGMKEWGSEAEVR